MQDAYSIEQTFESDPTYARVQIPKVVSGLRNQGHIYNAAVALQT